MEMPVFPLNRELVIQTPSAASMRNPDARTLEGAA